MDYQTFKRWSQRRSPAVEILEARRLFAIIYACDSNGELGTLDTSQPLLHASASPIGNMGVVMADIAFSPQGTLYGVDEGSNPSLYIINPNTAAVQKVGQLGTYIDSLAFSSSGTLYGALNSLFTINTSTGLATAVGNLGGFTAAGDLAFNNSGSLFLSTTAGELLQLNPNNAAISDLGSIGDDTVEGMAMGSDGVLYGILNDGDAIISINTATGQSNLVQVFTGLNGVTGADAAPVSFLPQSPSSLSATQGVLSDAIYLSWQPSPNARTYDVWRSTSADFSSAVEVASGISATQFSDASITQDLTYYYWVDANSPFGTSELSTAVSGFASSNLFTLAASAANGTPAANATVTLYNSAGNALKTQTTDPNGQTLWPELAAGSNRFVLRSQSGDLWADQTITVRPGITAGNISQTEPYESNSQVFSDNRDVTGGVVPLGKPIRIILTVANPADARVTVRAEPTLVNTGINISQLLKPISKTIPPKSRGTFVWSYTPRTNAQFAESVSIAVLSSKTFVATDTAVNLAPFSAGNRMLSVIVDDTGAYGLSTGSAIVARQEPLTDQLTINSDLDLWLDVQALHSAGASYLHNGKGVPGFFAAHNLMSPNGTLEYLSEFLKPGDTVTVSMLFDTRSVLCTVIDYIASLFGIPSFDDITRVAQDFNNIPAIHNLVGDLTPVPSTTLGWTDAIAKASLSFAELLVSASSEKQLAAALGKVGVKVSPALVKKVLTVYAIYGVLQNIGAQLTLYFQSQGAPIMERFIAQG